MMRHGFKLAIIAAAGVAALLVLAACAVVDPITGEWAGYFDNGISIVATLSLSSTTISGTFDTGDSQGTVSGTHDPPSFSLQLTATTGTQRTLSNAQLSSDGTRITADWDDGAGQSGELCLAKEGSTLCPSP